MADPPDAPRAAEAEPPTPLPPEITDPATPPEPDLLLPPLAGYRTDDRAEPGELEAALEDLARASVEAVAARTS